MIIALTVVASVAVTLLAVIAAISYRRRRLIANRRQRAHTDELRAVLVALAVHYRKAKPGRVSIPPERMESLRDFGADWERTAGGGLRVNLTKRSNS